MRRRDPALIVGLSARGHSWAILADDGSLISRVDSLGTAGRLLRALSALATASLLREQSGDPGDVDEVASPAKACGQEQVEKDAMVSQSSALLRKGGLLNIHLRVKDRHRRFYHAHRLIEHLLGEHCTLAVLQERDQVQRQVLRV